MLFCYIRIIEFSVRVEYIMRGGFWTR